MKFVVDSYAWMEIFLGSEIGRGVLEKIDHADVILTPDVVLAEIARKYLREGMEERVIVRRLASVSEASEIAHIDRSLALESARAFLELRAKAKKEGIGKPSPFDAIVLATARVNGAVLLSGDQHFRGLPETLWPSP